jgi:signal transduction histidine kinase
MRLVRDADGVPLEIIGYLVDVSTRKLAEEALRSAERELVNRGRLAAVGELAATMAHEVRNPLGVLFNSIGTLEKRLPAGGDTGALLAIMREEAQRLERLVRELLDFARPLSPSFAPESLDTLVHSAVEAATLEVGPNHAAISVKIAPDLPLVRVDASMMRQAIVNLLVNALQAASTTGTVDVHASLRKLEGQHFVCINVIDTGPGITPEIAPRVFDPFFTTKPTGTGLGLAVVKSIVESHGGLIELHSVPGAGTTIGISIAVDSERASA